MKYTDAINRARDLQEFEVQVTVPKPFRFAGHVPFDMEIVGDQAFVTVLALNIEEAVERAQAFFNQGTDDE
jgi:hypothetical protein